MRVLCTSMGSPSHARAELPLARALAGAGHEVTVAATAAVAPVFADDDVTLDVCLPPLPVTDEIGSASGASPPGIAREVDAPCGAGTARDVDREVDREVDAVPAPLRASVTSPNTALDAENVAHLDQLATALTGPYAREVLVALRSVARETRPDVIVRDGMDMAACLLAEELGVPQLPIPSGFANVVDPALVLPALNALRGEVGLPARDDPASLHPHGRFDYLPPAYSFADVPARTFAYRQTTTVERSGTLPAWVTRLPTDRPLVFAAVGTALPMFRDLMEAGHLPGGMPKGLPDPAELLRTIVAGLSELDVTAIVATAGIPLGGGAPSPHVHLIDRLPQPLMLECADLFVTHGGYNSVREAVRTATPMAVVPAFGDQHHNAQRVEDLGLGRHLAAPTPASLATACREILDDRAMAARLRAARLATLALPDLSQAPVDLAGLADVAADSRVAPPRAAV